MAKTHPEENEVTEAATLVKPEFIDKEVSKLSQLVTDTVIAQYEKEFMALKIEDVTNKDELKKVHDARMFIKKKRIEVENKRKELKSGIIIFGKAIDAEALRITSLLDPIETHLENEEQKVENEKKRLKELKEKEELERLNARKKILYDLEMSYNDLNEVFILDTYRLDLAGVQYMEDADFNEHVQKITELSNRLKTEKAAAEKKQRDDAEALKKLQKEQEDIRLANEETARKLKEQQDNIDKENARLLREKFERIHNRLIDIGCHQGVTDYFIMDAEGKKKNLIDFDSINTADEPSLNALINNNIIPLVEGNKEAVEKKKLADIEKAKEQAIQAEKQRAEDERRRNLMLQLGLKWDGEHFSFADINFHWMDLATMTTEEFDAAYTGAKARKEQIILEEEKRQAELKPDKEKISAFATELETLAKNIPQIKSAQLKKVLIAAQEELILIADKLNKQVKK